VSDLRNCVICRHQQTPRMACVDCTTAIDRMLADLPEFYALAAGEFEAASTGVGGNSIPLGLRIDALDGRAPRHAIWTLETWERDWRETLPAFGGADADLSQRKRKAQRWADATSSDFTGVNLCGVVDFLRIHLDGAACHHPAIDEFADEVRTIHAAARHAAGEDPDDVTIVLCPADRDRDGVVGACGARLTLAGEHVTCPRCGTDWDRPRLLLVARASGGDVYAPLKVLVEHFGVTSRTLQRWRKSGLVRGKGSAYHHGDVVAVLDGHADTDAG